MMNEFGPNDPAIVAEDEKISELVESSLRALSEYCDGVIIMATVNRPEIGAMTIKRRSGNRHTIFGMVSEYMAHEKRRWENAEDAHS
jgi:hypothetical protein